MELMFYFLIVAKHLIRYCIRVIYKLSQFGITGKVLGWITEFLNARIMRVNVRGSCSEWALVISGVPHGSVSGSQLFLLCVNAAWMKNNIKVTVRRRYQDMVKDIVRNIQLTATRGLGQYTTMMSEVATEIDSNTCKVLTVSTTSDFKSSTQCNINQSIIFNFKTNPRKNINTTQASQKIQGSSKLAAYCR